MRTLLCLLLVLGLGTMYSGCNSSDKDDAVPTSTPVRVVADQPLPDATVGDTYEYRPSTAGGTLPFTWSVEAGVLPSGLYQEPNTGRIYGIPTVTGVFTLQLVVQDANGNVGRCSTELTIN